MRVDRKALTFRKGDAVAIAAVVLAALGMIAYFLLSVNGQEAAVAKVYQNGQVIHELRMDRDADIVVDGEYKNRIVVKDGKVAILESSCPGEDCVHSGWISRPGRSIVCLPNRVEIRLEGGTAAEDDVDIVLQ